MIKPLNPSPWLLLDESDLTRDQVCLTIDPGAGVD